MKATTPFLIIIGLQALAGCGILPPPYVHDDSKIDPNYTTGSNFGRHGPAPSSMTKLVNKDDVEREAQALAATQGVAMRGRK